MNATLLNLELPGKLESVRQARLALKKTLNYYRINETLINTIQLVSSEVVTNYIEHNNSLEAISILVRISNDCFSIELYQVTSEPTGDNLRAWVDRIHASKDAPEPDLFSLERSGGRGASLIASLVDEVKFIAKPKNKEGLYSSGIRASWPANQSKHKPKLLLVDDEIALATIYENYLEAVYEVVSVRSTSEALSQLDHASFDVIVSDIHMPGEDGIQFRRRIMFHPNATQTPFVFLSGDHEAETNLGISRLGIDGFLSKPISKQKLIAELTRVQTRSKQMQELNDARRTQLITNSLLPSLPNETNYWRFANRSKSANCGGGDLITYKEYADACIIIIADLMGHDVAAKFFSHAYLGYIRGVLCASKPEPAAFLGQLSEALYSDELLSKSMCTCCVIELHNSGVVTVATAGHPPPLIIRQDAVSTFDTRGMLPGLMPGIVYSSSKYQLREYERVAAFTDGFLDPSCLDLNDVKNNPVLETLVQSINTPITTAADAAFHVEESSIDDRFKDDAALVLIERRLT